MVVRSKSDGLINHLKKWGLTVEAKDGWRERGRPYDFHPRAVIVHHTASGATSGNFGSEGVVTSGYSGLPGPLCQFLLGRNGTVKVIAAGYANHAGYGGPRGVVPRDQGNTYSYGIEGENNGIGETWTPAALNAYYRLCAALLDWLGEKDVSRVFGHKEWAPSRKIDPTGIDMDKFRAQVKRALDDGQSVKTVHLSRVQPGKRNAEVTLIKRRLERRGFYENAKNNNYFGDDLKNAYSRFQTHLGYKGRDANGIPGKVSLQKLGFRVRP